MNPQVDPAQNKDLEPVVQVPEVPAAPAPVVPDPQAGAPLPVAPASIPAAPAPAQPAPTPVAPAPTANPTTAEDIDVIEKEWVDKAEAVVKQTEGDPHAEEDAVEDLQTDYLKKRYNHTVDKSQEG
jgi:hypothetical protein